MRSRAFALCAALCAGSPLSAQDEVFRLTPVQGLTFGSTSSATPVAIPVGDALRSARFDISGPPRAVVRVTLHLPSTMRGTSTGSRLPLAFGSGDAMFAPGAGWSGGVRFDPRKPVYLTLPESGRGSILLGATVLPSRQLAADEYSASITIDLSPAGR